MRTSEDLVVKTFRAIVISEVESSIPVLVLDYELDPHVTGPGTHCFQLERSVVAREHAAVAVARIIHEGAGFLWIKAKRQHSVPDAVPGVTIGFLTSLLGQVAPSPKHLAWAFWVPKASMPVMAVMIEVVFILIDGFGVFSMLALWNSVRLEDFVEDNRGKTDCGLGQESSFIHVVDGIRT